MYSRTSGQTTPIGIQNTVVLYTNRASHTVGVLPIYFWIWYV